jgi:hypothetical protein
MSHHSKRQTSRPDKKSPEWLRIIWLLTLTEGEATSYLVEALGLNKEGKRKIALSE